MNIFHAFNWQREADVITELVDGGRRSIEVDHTIVGMLGNFAVAAFNSACEKVCCFQHCVQL